MFLFFYLVKYTTNTSYINNSYNKINNSFLINIIIIINLIEIIIISKKLNLYYLIKS